MYRAAIAVFFALCAGCQTAGQRSNAPSSAAARLEAMKALAGTWLFHAGGADSKDGGEVVYRVTGAGSVLEERLKAGAPDEMVTMIHADGSDLVLTHYCVLGNQPRMRCRAPGAKGPLAFVCDGGGTNMASEKDPHMHSVVYEVIDRDHLRSTWTMHEGGKEKETARFELVRQGS